MKRSFSVVANSGHLHMYLWGELYGGIRALGLSLCQSEDFILTKASDDIAGVDLSRISLSISFGVGIALGVAVDLGGISLRIRTGVSITLGASIASGVGIASGVEVAAAIRVGIAAAFSITAAAAFTAGVDLGRVSLTIRI